MSYTYLQEQGEESSAANFSAMPASVLSRLNLTAAACCCNASGTDACQSFQSGTTCGHSTGDRGEDSSMSCAADSHARTFQQPDAAKESPASGLDSGEKWPASLAKYDPDSCLWRTHQFSLRGDLEPFLETWPRWGLMRGGECWEVQTLAGHTLENESGYLPTPCKTEGRDWSQATILARLDKGGRVCRRLCSVGLSNSQEIVGLNPSFAEWMMDWPIGWTDLQRSATDRFQAWLHSHGER
jgi:hypothetical protein